MDEQEQQPEEFAIEPSDEEGNAVAAKGVVSDLRQKLKAAEHEKKINLEGWQRAKADYSNLKRELEEARAVGARLLEQDFLTDLLPVLDSFYFAFNNKEAWEAVDENWRKGVLYIHGQLQEVLKNRGLSAFDDLGKPFDPLRHQAISEMKTENAELVGTVAQVLKLGYCYRQQVIRPSSVVVYVSLEE